MFIVFKLIVRNLILFSMILIPFYITAGIPTKEQKNYFCNKEQVLQKIKQVLYLAAPSLIMNIYPNMVPDLLKKLLGEPDRRSYYNHCLVSYDIFYRIS